MTKDYDVVIIGAGLGGLTCGAYLTKYGYKVLLLEQRHCVGGFCSSFARNGYCFDAAVHFLEGGGVNSIGGDSAFLHFLKEIGIEKELDLIKFQKNYTLEYPQSRITVTEDFSGFLRMLKAKYPSASNNLDEFFRLAGHVKEEIFHLLPRFHVLDLLKMTWQSPFLFKFRHTTFQELVEQMFQERELQFVFTAPLFMFLGAPSSRISASIGLYFYYLLHYENFYYPKGGTQQLSDVLKESICASGGAVLVNKRVDKIIFTGKKAVAVRTADGDEVRAEIIVSAMDVRKLLMDLVPPDKQPKKMLTKINNFSPSFSFNQMWLGLDYNPLSNSEYSNEIVHFDTIDLEELYGRVKKNPAINSYVASIPTLLDPGLAPANHHILALISPAVSDNVPQREDKAGVKSSAYTKYKENFFTHSVSLLERLFPEIRSHITEKVVATPLTLAEFTGSLDGSAYGWIVVPEQFGHNAVLPCTPFKNIFLTGHWTYPCGGVLGAFYSGRSTAKLIALQQGKKFDPDSA